MWQSCRKGSKVLKYVQDQFKTQEMCNQAVEKYAGLLEDVPCRFITQEMCDKAVEVYPGILRCRGGFRNDFLVRQIWIKIRTKTRTSRILKDLFQLGKILVRCKAVGEFAGLLEDVIDKNVDKKC